MYEIKDINGKVVYTKPNSFFALGCYETVKNQTGYAEIWYNGECIFKTR
jgi:hypothetical protein